MQLRVLGPVELAGPDGPVAMTARMLRALLAALAIGRGTTRSADELIDALWGESPPPSARKLLQVYVGQLRRVLPEGVTLTTRGAGYGLLIDPDEIDAVRFERLVADGRAASRDGNPAVAASLLSRALALWRGPAYADVHYEDFARKEVTRLEMLRMEALVERIEADLRLGRHADVVGELRGLVAADPTDERLAALAILATHRAAGPAAALDYFETLRAAICQELGEEPGPELVALRDRVEQRDASLAWDGSAVAGPPRSLPVPTHALIGRRRELGELRDLLARPTVRLVSLTGAGGSGKSRLALELARELALNYANGAVVVELASLTDPTLVMPTIARAFGLDPESDAMAVTVEGIRDREVLLIVDNLEHLRASVPELVHLLACVPRLVVVATTRVVLHASGEHVYPVAPLDEDDSIALFLERARAQDPSLIVDPTARQLVGSICRRLDGLPLAIELAASRVRALGLAALDERLATRLSLVIAGPRDLPARQRTLRETIAWSFNLLEAREAEVLAALAVFPGSFSIEGARAVAAADDDVIVALVDHSLIHVFDQDGERRFRLLETVREYGYELLGERRAAAEWALTTWILEVIKTLQLDAAGSTQIASLQRLDRELDSLREALRHAARAEDPTTELSIAARVWRYWWIRGLVAEARGLLDGIFERRGLIATWSGVRTARATASLAWSGGDLERAVDVARDALGVAEQVGDTIELVSLHNLLGVMANTTGDFAAAERHLRVAIGLAEASGLDELANTSKVNLGVAYLDAGRLDDARTWLREVLDARRADGELSEGMGFVHMNLGYVEYDAGNMAAAEVHFRAAAETFRAVGFHARFASAI